MARTRERVRAALAGLCVLTAAAPACAAERGLARTPPMGFNGWNAFGCHADERLIAETADRLVTSGLRDAGYRYVNIDDCWAAARRDPRTGRLVADPATFPHGIRWLADRVHRAGLRLGIYSSAGVTTCEKAQPGSLDHEKLDARTFADWGVDYLKYDNCGADARPAPERYAAMRDALRETGRPIVYAICEWGREEPWRWGPRTGQLWRTTADIKDRWSSVMSILKTNAPLAPYAGPGHWNDPDMLEVGNGGMTTREYRSHFSLWAIMAAPLLIGTDLRSATPRTLAILGNREVIAVDQDPLGTQGTVRTAANGHWVIAKPLRDGDVAVALFNETGQAAAVATTARALGLPARPAYAVRDLWAHRDTTTTGAVSASVPPHGTVLYRVGPA